MNRNIKLQRILLSTKEYGFLKSRIYNYLYLENVIGMTDHIPDPTR